MIYSLIYMLLTLIACTLGAISGIGGGVIIKPIMEALGEYDLISIEVLSSITVLTMTTVSLAYSLKQKKRLNLKMVIFMSLGGIAGGSLGHHAFKQCSVAFDNLDQLALLQNAIVIVLLILVIIEELFRKKIKVYQFNHLILNASIGFVLGFVSAFLGIGGGIFNKPVLIILIGLAAKEAATASLAIIFFSQLANLATMYHAQTLVQSNLEVMPQMMIGAVAGGIIGAIVAKKVSLKRFDQIFLITLMIVLGINLYNFIKYLL